MMLRCNSAAEPLVSVIIPTYDRYDFLMLALCALERQTFRNFEVIVVGDGSPPQTEAVVRRFSNVRYLRTENRGIVCARNAGISIARGELLAFCDDDDQFLPNKLAEQTDIFLRFPKVQYSFTNFSLLVDGVQKSGTKFDAAPPEFFKYRRFSLEKGWHIVRDRLLPYVLKFHPAFPSTVMLRKEFFKAIGGFNERYSRFPAEDFEFTLRASAFRNAAICDEPLSDVRKHSRNYSGHVLRTSLSCIQILQDVLSRPRGFERFHRELRASLTERAEAAALLAFEARDWEKFHQMLALCPAGSCARGLAIKRTIAQLPRPLRNSFADWVEKGVACIRASQLFRPPTLASSTS